MLFRRKRRILRIRGLLSAVAHATAAHTAPTGPVWGFAGVLFPYPALKTAHKRPQGRVWFFSPKRVYPLPLKGEGRGITFLGLVGFALLVQNWGTLAQQGRSGGFGGVVPLPGVQNRTQGHTGPSLGSPFFSWSAFAPAGLPSPAPACSYCLLDRPDGKLQCTISHLASLSPHLSGFYVDELLLLQLTNVLGYGC